MKKEPLKLSETARIPVNPGSVFGDSAALRIKRLTGKSSLVAEALAHTDLRFTLVKKRAPVLRVA